MGWPLTRLSGCPTLAMHTHMLMILSSEAYPYGSSAALLRLISSFALGDARLAGQTSARLACSMLSFIGDIFPIFSTELCRCFDCTSISLFAVSKKAQEARRTAAIFCTTYSSRVRMAASRPRIPLVFKDYTCRGCLRLAMVAERFMKMSTVLEQYLTARVNVAADVAMDVRLCDSLTSSLSVIASELLTDYDCPGAEAEWIVGHRIFSTYFVDSTLAGVYRIISNIGIPEPRQSAHAVLAAYEEVESDLRFIMGRHVLPYAAVRSIVVPPPSMDEVLRLSSNSCDVLG